MFRCMECTFYIQNFWAICVGLPWKTELPQYFSLYLNMYFLLFRIFEQLCACSEQNWPGIFHWIVYTFYIQEFWATCMRLSWKTEGSLNLLYRIYIFVIQKFWVTCACPEKQSCPDIFHSIDYTLYIQEFWATCACPEKQSCPEIFRCMEYSFYIQNFWATCMRLPWKTGLPWYFSLYWTCIFYYSGVLSNLRLPWKT